MKKNWNILTKTFVVYFVREQVSLEMQISLIELLKPFIFKLTPNKVELNDIDKLFPHNKVDNSSQLGHETKKYGQWLCILGLHVFIFRTNATWTPMYTWLDLIGIPGAEISVMRRRWIVALPITCLNACSTSQGTWRPSSPIRPLPVNCQESGGTEWGKFWSLHLRQINAS